MKLDPDVNRILFALPCKSTELSVPNIEAGALTLKALASNFASWKNGPSLEEFLNPDNFRLIPKSV